MLDALAYDKNSIGKFWFSITIIFALGAVVTANLF